MKTHEELMQMKADALTAHEDAKALAVKSNEAVRARLEADQKASDLYSAYQKAVSEIYFTNPAV